MSHTDPPTTPKRNSGKIPWEAVIQSPYFSPSKGSSKGLGATIFNPTDTEKLGSPLERLNCVKEDGTPGNLSFPTPRYIQMSGQSHNSCVGGPIMWERLRWLKPNLIQERVADDPWKLLVAVTLLNKTAGKLAIPTFYDILAKWPTPFELSQADEKVLVKVIRHLGTQNIRARRLIAISKAYVQEPPSLYDIRSSTKISTPRRRSSRFFTSAIASAGQSGYPGTPISHYPGTGPYALDSYRIFSSVRDDPESEEWKTVMPTDKELILFLKWKWAFVEGKEWSATKGVVREITRGYLTLLVTQLEKNTVTSSFTCPPSLSPKLNNIQNSI